MAAGDTLNQAYPNSTHKQDWAYYPFVGGRGAGGNAPTTGVTRYTFWVDFDPFDVKNLKMLSENISFQIFNDTLLTTPYVPLLIIDQSNDITDELVRAAAPTKQGVGSKTGTATIIFPPFGYLDTGASSNSAGSPPTSSSLPAVTGAVASTGNGTATGLTLGTIYFYCITAVNASFVESLPSAVVAAMPTAQFPSIGVTFNNNVPGALYYNIYRNTTGIFTSGNNLYQTQYYPGQPPYYLDTTFTSQPKNLSFRNDQGSYTINANKGYGVLFGSGNMVGQGFVPQQSQLTAFTFGEIFHTNTSDHTTYQNLKFELWDSNKTFYRTLGTLAPTYNAAQSGSSFPKTPAGLTLTDGNGNTAYCNTITYNTQDDGIVRWTDLQQFQIQLADPIPVTPGSTYYIMCRTPVQTGTSYYALGGNYDGNVVRDPSYYYPFAPAVQAVDGSSTFSNLIDNNGNQITFPFLTLGNVGRYAFTFWWANIGNGANNYWPSVPNSNEYQFLHIDYISRI